MRSSGLEPRKISKSQCTHRLFLLGLDLCEQTEQRQDCKVKIGWTRKEWSPIVREGKEVRERHGPNHSIYQSPGRLRRSINSFWIHVNRTCRHEPCTQTVRARHATCQEKLKSEDGQDAVMVKTLRDKTRAFGRMRQVHRVCGHLHRPPENGVAQ